MQDAASLHVDWRVAPRPDTEVVIFLHDGLGATGSWQTMPERIAAATGLSAMLYDRWGYGRSAPREAFPFGFMEQEVPVLLDLLDREGIARPHLVGHSDGGSIALLFAARHPERVRSVVTEAAHVFVEPETQAGIRALLEAKAAGQMPRWLERLHGERAAALLDAWGSGWLTPAHARWNIEDCLAQVRCPLLVIQGDRDEFGTLAQVEAIVSRAPNAQRWVARDCGHTPHAEAADHFAERVSAFLRAHMAHTPD
jgi:pimeloyl-ACP methyl ester carboxylesterase